MSGEAGWFEINPSSRYKATYDAICEAITLYYHVMDAYEAKAVNLSGPKRQDLFKKLNPHDVLFQVRPPGFKRRRTL